MAKYVFYEIGETTHVIELNGSVPPDQNEIKMLIADHISAPVIDFSLYTQRPSREEQLDERLKHAGVTSFKVE